MSEIEKNEDNGLNPFRKPKQFFCDSGLATTEVLTRLKAMEDLPSDWSASGALPPNKTALLNSTRAMSIFEKRSLFPRDVGPSVEAGVGFTFSAGGQFAYVEFFNDGMVSFLIDSKGKNRQVWEVNGDQTQLEESISRVLAHLQM